MKFFLQKQLKTIIIFPKRSILDLLPGSKFSSLNEYSLTCRVTPSYVLYDTYGNSVCYYKFRHIQLYSRPIQTYSAILRRIQNPLQSLYIQTFPYSESWHIWNLRYIQNSVKPYSGIFRHIQAYSGIFNDDSYNNINFLFFNLISHTLQRNLKRHNVFQLK